MGEFAHYYGDRVKIGTCEDMYYLRFNQRWDISADSESVNPADDNEAKGLRFRFPFPWEDNIAPGGYSNAFEAFRFDADLSEIMKNQVHHHSVQFKADPGYLVSLPCPEGPDEQPFKVHRNGFKGHVHLVQQGVREGCLSPIFQCGGCRAKFYVPQDALAPALEKLLADYKHENDFQRRRLTAQGEDPDKFTPAMRHVPEIVRRIMEGYEVRFNDAAQRQRDADAANAALSSDPALD